MPLGGKRSSVRLQSTVAGGDLTCFIYPGSEQIKGSTTIAEQFAPDKIDALDAGCTFMDRVQSVVAIELLHVEIAGVTISAMNLDSEIACHKPPFRGPRLGRRRQQPEQVLSLSALLRAGRGLAFINQPRAKEDKG